MTLSCEDCGLPYETQGWIDTVVSAENWKKIMPGRGGGGILCMLCMAARFEKLGMRDVPMYVASGPFATTPQWVNLETRYPEPNVQVLVQLRAYGGMEVYDVACFTGPRFDGKMRWILTDVRLESASIRRWAPLPVLGRT